MSGARKDRIPADLAFVVRTDGRKFLLWIGGLTLAGYLLLCCVAGSALYLVARDLDGVASGVLALVLIPLVAAGGLLALPLLMARHRFIGQGPLLAADQAGLWVRHVGLFSRPIWLPWEAVASVSIKRQLFEELVWIDADPRHPGVPPGTRLPVTTLLSDRSATEIVTALALLAAGRTRFC